MTQQANNLRLERYWDYHEREDEEVGQSFYHAEALKNLVDVLTWMYRAQNMGVVFEINLYHKDVEMAYAPSPDLMVLEGVQVENRPPGQPLSYYVGKDGAAPRVVVEFSSEKTWSIDLGANRQKEVSGQKPAVYEKIGVTEYFAFDPHQPTFWTKDWKKENRLVGWRLNAEGKYERISKNEDGWLWSEQLNSFLVVENQYLRLYDENRQLRLTSNQYAKLVEQRAKLEQQQAELERQRVAEAQQRAETAEREKEVLLEKLRRAGIDPDSL